MIYVYVCVGVHKGHVKMTLWWYLVGLGEDTSNDLQFYFGTESLIFLQFHLFQVSALHFVCTWRKVVETCILSSMILVIKKVSE